MKNTDAAPAAEPKVPMPPPTQFIEQSFFAQSVSPVLMDRLWRKGWRHFGPYFVRYSVSLEIGTGQVVQPLRVALERFRPSKSHRRLLRRNADLTVKIERPDLDETRHEMFDQHKTRFSSNVPESLHDFLGPYPDQYPCELMEVGVYDGPCLVAASYLDVGREATSGVYAMFRPDFAHRGLGIYTMLLEMLYARKRNCRFYYPGYAFHEPSLLDYKKQFQGTEWFDWRGNWFPLAGRNTGEARS